MPEKETVKETDPMRIRMNELLGSRTETLLRIKSVTSVEEAGIEALKASATEQRQPLLEALARDELEIVHIASQNRKRWIFRPGKRQTFENGTVSFRNVPESVVTDGVDTKKVAQYAARIGLASVVRVVLELDKDAVKSLTPKELRRLRRKFPDLRVTEQEIIQVKGKSEKSFRTLLKYLYPKPRPVAQD